MGPGRPGFPLMPRGSSSSAPIPPQNGPFDPNMAPGMPGPMPGMQGGQAQRRPTNLRIHVPENGPYSAMHSQPQQHAWNASSMPQSPRYVLAQLSPRGGQPPQPFGGMAPYGRQSGQYYAPHGPHGASMAQSPNPNGPFEPPERQRTPNGDFYPRGHPGQGYGAPTHARAGFSQQSSQPPPRAGNGSFANPPPPSRSSLQGSMSAHNAPTPPQNAPRTRERENSGNSVPRKRARRDDSEKGHIGVPNPGTPQTQPPAPPDDFIDSNSMAFGDAMSGAVSLDGEMIDPNAMFSYMDDSSLGEAENKLVTPSRELAHTGSKVLACALNYEGSILATVGREKDLFLWETATGKLKRLSAHTDSVCDVRFCHQRNTLLATCSDDGTARVWDLHGASSQPVALLQAESAEGSNSVFTAVDFHPSDHTLLATTQSDSAVRLWSTKNVPSGGRAHCVAEVGAGIKQARFSPRNDGRAPALLVAGFEAKVNVFEVHDSNVAYLHTLGAHEKTVHCVQWDKDGKYVLSVSEDAVNVWDPHQRSLLRTFSRSPTKFYSCTFHPDSSNVILVGSYQNLFQWDWTLDGAGTRAVSGPQRIHESIVGALATSTRPHQLASVSHDGAVKLWSTTS